MNRLECIKEFYKDFNCKIDFSISTDGRLILSNGVGTINAFQLDYKSDKDAFYQLRRRVKAYNSKAALISKFGIFVALNNKKYLMFDLTKHDLEDAVVVPLTEFNSPLELKILMENTLLQKGWIDENSIVAYSNYYFALNKKANKEDFIKELSSPTILNIEPYIWNSSGEMERKLLDYVGSRGTRKSSGTFFTPDDAAKKSTEYVRNIIKSLPNDNYVIIDRCAGTGNLEKFFTDEELSHCILNTINYTEWVTLNELYGNKVKKILPENKDIRNGSLIHGDALSEEFDNYLKKYIGKNTIVVGLENPPYSNIDNNKDSFISKKMKENKLGREGIEIANRFIWSGFEYYFDYYVLYSPIKYWKSQHLIDKKFLNGIILNREDFHATKGGISLISWKNENSNNEFLQLENCLVKKIHSGYNTTIIPEDSFEDSDIIFINNDGVLNDKSAFLTNNYISCHAKTIKVGLDNIKQTMPLFAANCYEYKDYTEREIVMKSGDKGKLYLSDEKFLNDCLIYCCLTDKNKCISDNKKTNKLCLCQGNKIDNLIEYNDLISEWKNILNLISKLDKYNPNYKYGLFQIENDFPEIDVKYFKNKLKDFYNKNIISKVFKYELLK